jgi:hypothetical protein
MKTNNINGVKEIVADAGKYLHRVNDDTFFTRGIMMSTETEADFVQVDYMPTEEVKKAIDAKIKEIEAYDKSDAVNSFSINGVTAWFTAEERKGYEQSILSCETLGVTTISVPIAGNVITMNVADAKVMLAKIHLYADSCYMVTQTHIAAVRQLTSIDDVKKYDFKSGYPEKLTLTI